MVITGIRAIDEVATEALAVAAAYDNEDGTTGNDLRVVVSDAFCEMWDVFYGDTPQLFETVYAEFPQVKFVAFDADNLAIVWFM